MCRNDGKQRMSGEGEHHSVYWVSSGPVFRFTEPSPTVETSFKHMWLHILGRQLHLTRAISLGVGQMLLIKFGRLK